MSGVGPKSDRSAVSSNDGLVSVVIPSRDAGAELFRAIASVRAQTYPNIELIVVLDNASPSEDTLAKLRGVVDKVIQTAVPVGGSGARNRGIEAATGKWIALLDDDDVWRENKLQRQIDTAAALSAHAFPVISTRVLVQQGEEQRTWPLKPAPTGDPMRISEYLFCVSSPTKRGEGFVQTSTLFASRQLFLETPFTDGLRIHQDWDWLLRASSREGFHLDLIWEPLTVYYLNVKGTSVSQTKDWRPSFAWATGNPLISPRAYSYFLATVVARYVPLSSLPKVLWAFLTRSRVDVRSAILFALFFSFPEKQRLRVAQWLRKK
jgi:glycosyltransferase involved in cell wall biosynthesis